jgi:hypothetical protein
MDPPLDGSSGTGIELHDIAYPDSGSLVANSISNYWHGIFAVYCDNMKISNTVMSYTSIGVRTWLCSPIEIDEVQIYNESPCSGVQFLWDQASTIKISNSTFASNSSSPNLEGILFYLSHSNSSLRRTVIENFSDNGVRCDRCEPDLGTDTGRGHNKILSDSGYYVYHNPGAIPIGSPPDSVSAQYNWWGEYPPDSNRFHGNVTFMPADSVEWEDPDSLQQKVVASQETPKEFELVQNYPNPFNPITSIEFTVANRPNPVYTTLRIYNVLGRLVRTLVDEENAEGTHTVSWDGRSDSGREVSSGIYFYKLEAGDLVEVKKMVLLR